MPRAPRESRRRLAPDCPNIWVCHANEFPDAHYVGREWAGRAASPLGNPYSGRNSDDPIGAFDAWLKAAWRAAYNATATPAQHAAMGAILDLADIYREHGRLELSCWCSPEPCHADVVARAVMAVVRNQPRFVDIGGRRLLVSYDEESAAEGLPFVAECDGAVVRVCASYAHLRAVAPLAHARHLHRAAQEPVGAAV